jgi:hypothetical protein
MLNKAEVETAGRVARPHINLIDRQSIGSDQVVWIGRPHSDTACPSRLSTLAVLCAAFRLPQSFPLPSMPNISVTIYLGVANDAPADRNSGCISPVSKPRRQRPCQDS